MRIVTLILVGLALSFLGLWLHAYINENGDINAMSMYIVVFGLEAIGLAIVNSLFLKFLEKKIEKTSSIIVIGSLPLLPLIVLLFSGIVQLTFIGKFGLTGIGITNFIWVIVQIRKEKTSASV